MDDDLDQPVTAPRARSTTLFGVPMEETFQDGYETPNNRALRPEPPSVRQPTPGDHRQPRISVLPRASTLQALTSVPYFVDDKADAEIQRLNAMKQLNKDRLEELCSPRPRGRDQEIQQPDEEPRAASASGFSAPVLAPLEIDRSMIKPFSNGGAVAKMNAKRQRLGAREQIKISGAEVLLSTPKFTAQITPEFYSKFIDWFFGEKTRHTRTPPWEGSLPTAEGIKKLANFRTYNKLATLKSYAENKFDIDSLPHQMLSTCKTSAEALDVIHLELLYDSTDDKDLK